MRPLSASRQPQAWRSGLENDVEIGASASRGRFGRAPRERPPPRLMPTPQFSSRIRRTSTMSFAMTEAEGAWGKNVWSGPLPGLPRGPRGGRRRRRREGADQAIEGFGARAPVFLLLVGRQLQRNDRYVETERSKRARPGRPGSVRPCRTAPTMIASGLEAFDPHARMPSLKISAVSLPRSRAWKVV